MEYTPEMDHDKGQSSEGICDDVAAQRLPSNVIDLGAVRAERLLEKELVVTFSEKIDELMTPHRVEAALKTVLQRHRPD